MESPRQWIQWINVVPYEIVEKNYRKMKIIVFIGGIKESSLKIIAKTKRLYVYAKDPVDDRCLFCSITLGFKPKRLSYIYRNGVLTIIVERKLLFIL